MNEPTDEQMKRFQERMDKRKEQQEADEKEKADRLRQDYLRRTGRKEMKP